MRELERVQTVVIGGGQAGLSVGHHLARRGRPFVVLEAGARVGDAWRGRWDSLRLFSPARFDGIDGMPFPGPPDAYPTKDEMADYLERYAAHFRLPVRTSTRVDRVTRNGDRYLVEAGDTRIEAEHVVVAMADFQRPRMPSWAAALDPAVASLHSSAYRNPSQLREGGVLVVGAGNSGAEIAIELARAGRRVWLAGRDVGQIPFRSDGLLGRLILLRLLFRVVFHRVLTVRTPIGRRARPKLLRHVTPLIRTRWRDLAAAGVERVPRVVGARDGRPVLEDGRVLDVPNVVWCTGYESSFSWIDLPVFDDEGRPVHEDGVVVGEPGLYFVGLHFLHAASSAMIHGVGRDAARIAEVVARRTAMPRAVARPVVEAVPA